MDVSQPSSGSELPSAKGLVATHEFMDASQSGTVSQSPSGLDVPSGDDGVGLKYKGRQWQTITAFCETSIEKGCASSSMDRRRKAVTEAVAQFGKADVLFLTGMALQYCAFHIHT